MRKRYGGVLYLCTHFFLSMEKHLLSKSTFIRAVQCKKSLYLHKRRPWLRDKLSAEQRAKFQRGTRVGALARELFPGGVNLAPGGPARYQKAVEATRDAIEKEQPVIYEASFQYDRVLTILDILVEKEGKYYAYEVKSSQKITPVYIKDVALQYYVIKNSGLELEDFFIVHVNPDYVYEGSINIRDYFVIKSIREEVQDFYSEIATRINDYKAVLQLKKSPAVDIGAHCYDPYPCDFLGHCWKHVADNSVFQMMHLSREEQFDFYQRGLASLDDLEPEMLSETGSHELEAFKSGKPVYSRNQINRFREAFREPYLVMSLVFIKPALPLMQGTSPYELQPALLHVMDEQGKTRHTWIINPEEQGFTKFYQIIKQIENSGMPVYLFADQKETKYIQSKLNNLILNLSHIFSQLYYIDPRLKGEAQAWNIAQSLLDENPLKKDMPDTATARIIMEAALEEADREKQEEMMERVQAFSKQYALLVNKLLRFFYELI